jgi:pyridoxine 5-phosphate synthase
MTELSVNVDHVATLRQARGTTYPDPTEAARVAMEAGATGITVHLRSDRRHIQERDVTEIRQSIQGKLNLEMATTDEMVNIALQIRPDQVTLVPERPEEITTEGGLDLVSVGDRALLAAERLSSAGIEISAFIDPEEAQVGWLAAHGASSIRGFEINTDRYARATQSTDGQIELAAIQQAAEAGESAGLHVYAGHALTTDNVGPIAAIRQIEELNIGHFLIGRAVVVGMAAAVREMLNAMRQAADSRID